LSAASLASEIRSPPTGLPSSSMNAELTGKATEYAAVIV
jgi:hypothetical protein